jgi:hypothetical protein
MGFSQPPPSVNYRLGSSRALYRFSIEHSSDCTFVRRGIYAAQSFHLLRHHHFIALMAEKTRDPRLPDCETPTGTPNPVAMLASRRSSNTSMQDADQTNPTNPDPGHEGNTMAELKLVEIDGRSRVSR